MTRMSRVADPHALSPLRAKRIVNTRSLDQAPELDDLLYGRGAIPLSYPCIEIAPPPDTTSLDLAVRGLLDGDFDWLVFTSANAVRSVADACARVSGALPGCTGTQVAAIGPGTARAVWVHLGLEVDAQPATYTAEAFGKELLARRLGRVLLPLSEQASHVLPRTLRAAGAQVSVVDAYRTIVGSGGVELADLLRRDQVDVVTFTSPSTVDNLAVRLEREGGEWADLKRRCVACIGPTTAEAAARRGLSVQVRPKEQTLHGLVEALETLFALASNARSCG
ncbi:MAG: uroporphyrinogen-III synthase [Thermoleophilia bacterium]|nr:uroporphyrinogen-III synthase [Thermoleophilia bacterium]